MNIADILKQDGTIIIDVREPFENSMKNIKGAINIPLGEIPNNVDKIKGMNAPIVFHCASGGRSGQAVAFLQQKGLENVYNGGGLADMLMVTGQFF